MRTITFNIFQLTDAAFENCQYAFRSWEYALEHGFSFSDYESVYTGAKVNCSNDDAEVLENLFSLFNCGNYPEDYKGHSLSVSDIISISFNGNVKYYYCDIIGFEDITENIDGNKKRVWTSDEIKELVASNDKVLYGALKKLYACQTNEEQICRCTSEHNGVGFNGIDGPILSSFAEFLIRTGFLTNKQKEIARKKLVKYTKQLTALANI